VVRWDARDAGKLFVAWVALVRRVMSARRSCAFTAFP